MTSLRVITVDAFTGPDAQGNPAGVAILPAYPDDATLRAVAAEMDHSETAFLVESHGDWRLRWFTPTTEVPLCGHATLASAHVLWESDRVPRGAPIRFHTLSGLLEARTAQAGIRLDLPAVESRPIPTPAALTAALGETARWTRRAAEDYVVALADAGAVRRLRPDLEALAAVDRRRGAIVTAPGDGDADYVCRYFAPHVGIPEDPATGYAQCILGPLWAEATGRDELRAHQLSQRGGRFLVRPRGDRVEVEGRAATRGHRTVAFASRGTR